jgi:hypothetical protein
MNMKLILNLLLNGGNHPLDFLAATRKTDDGIAITEDSFQVGPAFIPSGCYPLPGLWAVDG